MKEKRILIIGAGPAGLGAGLALYRSGYENWDIYEKEDHPGGLAASFRDEMGFTWDLGGHVLFSRDPFFLRLFEEVMAGEYIEHQREAWVWYKGRWVPYPFQNNVRHLPAGELASCVWGLIKERSGLEKGSPRNFYEWARRTFGEGIFDCFMGPYNRKVWCYSLEDMGFGWIADRVSVPSVWRILRNVLLKQDDVEWGPNNIFKFPKRGGTGDIFKRMSSGFESRIHYGKKVVGVDLHQRTIETSDGEVDGYDVLISTVPVDDLVSMIKANGVREVRESAKGLRHNKVTVVGIGLERPHYSTRCWMYFPESKFPFYRVTNFSHYSPFNVPEGDVTRYSSLMCETSHMGDRSEGDIVEETIKGLEEAGFMEKSEEPISIFTTTLGKAYPIPTIDRDARLEVINRFLGENGIHSIGRFGTWRYEVGNMDHAVIMGYKLAQVLVGDIQHE